MLKTPAEALNLTAELPQVIKYKRSLIKTLMLIIILIILISLFWTMQKKATLDVKKDKEEQLNFEQITPMYKHQYVKNQKTLEQIKETKNQAPISEHNISLLKEYFEQQALIKIKEEDDARVSPTSFMLPTIEADYAHNKLTQNNLDVNNNLGTNIIPNAKLLTAGSIIPCVLSNAINSDLPGIVVARVRESVFDSATGKYLLIPQGSILVGHYNNHVIFGQERAEIVFERIDVPPHATNPHGKTIQLDNWVSSDLEGYSGISDKVDNHYDKVALGVSLSSLLAAASKVPTEAFTYRERATNKASENISDIANKIADKQIKQNPTIIIRGGVPFNIIVAKDLAL